MQSQCPNCRRSYLHQLAKPWVVVCSYCQSLVKGERLIKPEQLAIPDDWSKIQVGTTGTYRDSTFVITGRLRMQMKNDFRNLWCARYKDDVLWIGQSLETLGFFSPPFAPYPAEIEKELAAGGFVKFSEGVKLKCEVVDFCLSLKYEGELGWFPFITGNFNFIQANNAEGNTALIFKGKENHAHFLWGVSALVYGVTFENTKRYPEWESR